VSSTYYVLCLSHDPAIAASSEHGTPENAEAAIRDGIEGHADCDLMIARSSGAVVEIGCPSSTDKPPKTGRCYHRNTEWTDTEWARLLAAAYQSTDPAVQAAAKTGRFTCLPWERLRRLRLEVGFTALAEETP
jgi:hypothetical protein